MTSASISFAQGDYWTEYANAQPAVSTNVGSISIVNDNVVWCNNGCGTANCTAIRRYSRSVNSGLNWTTGVVDLGAASQSLEISNISGTSASTAYVSAHPKANVSAIGGVWKTTDGGLTWNRQATATYGSNDSFANLVHFFDANNGVTMGDPDGGYFEIYTTSNGGTTWTRVPSSNIPLPLFGPAPTLRPEFGLTNQYTVTGDAIWIGTTNGRILKSVNRGLNWTITQSPIPDFGGGENGTTSGDLAFTDVNNGLLLTNEYSLYGTSDGGVTWTEITYAGVDGNEPTLGNFGLSEIPGLPNAYVAVGIDLLNDPVRGSYYTINGGLNWTVINDNPDLNYVDGGVISFYSPTVGFAGGFSTSAAIGGIFKWNGNDLYLANTKFSSDNKFSISPNPTTGKFT